MPKKSTHQKGHIADITINDSANSKQPNGRLRKGILLTTNRLKGEIVNVDDIRPDDNEDELILKMHGLKRKNKKNCPNDIETDENIEYAYYPMDIWFLIGKHIRPEDVCRFALICRQTAFVCSTSSFWLNLYRTNYHYIENLPVRLQPECMMRIGGLRACVIRTLFHVYKPFADRLTTLAAQDFHNLVKRECLTSWCSQDKDNWIFCYKFKQKISIGSRQEMSERLRKTNRLLDIFNDLYQNPEEGCKILVIKTSSFRPLIQSFGQQLFLGAINQTLAQGFINYKLQMSFRNHCNEHIASITYDPVIQIQTLDWWTPAYHTYLD